MSTPDIRAHLGNRTLAHMSQRDWPDGVVQACHEEDEMWLYEDGLPVRRLDGAEAWGILNQGGKP